MNAVLAALLVYAVKPTPSPSPVTPAVDLGSAPGLFIANSLSAIVLAAVVTGLFNDLGKRGDSKVAARKDVREGESEVVEQYRRMSDQAAILAEQARKSAETAVTVIQNSLKATQELVTSLQATVVSQNETIRQLTSAANVQDSALARMTEDRDRTQAALDRAQALYADQDRRRAELEDELRVKEAELAAAAALYEQEAQA